MLNTFVSPDFYPASAELFIVAMAMVVLFADLAFGKTQRWVAGALTQITLIAAAGIVYVTADGQSTLTFSNMFVDDVLADFLKIVTCIAVVMSLVYSRQYLADRKLDSGEFYMLVLFATLGMLVMISAAHFVTLYIGLELMSLSLYGLVAIDRDSSRATEAAMKYFVLGALASGLLLYGMSMLYGATGTLQINGILQGLIQGNVPKTIAVFGLVFTVAGLAFKLGVVPFHMWIPDVYQGAPTPVTLLIGAAPKLAAVAMTLRMLVFGLLGLAAEWQQMLLLLAIMSMALGNFAAIAQTNIKRMLAYSAIAHMGFMLLGLTTGVIGGQLDPFALTTAYGSSLYYVVAYVLMTSGAFAMLMLLSRHGVDVELLDDFKGLNKRSPWYAAIMAIMMFSMAGIPFFIGFFAKFSILVSVIKAGYVEVAVIAVMLSLIGAFYYLRVVKYMYFDAPTGEQPAIDAPLDMRVLLTMNGAAVALLGIFPQQLMDVCMSTVLRSL